MKKGYKWCHRCERSRQLRFFSGPRGRYCIDCRKKKTAATSHASRTEAKYQITGEEYKALLEAQGGGCAICGQDYKGRKRLSVDHDHKVEKTHGTRASVRGLLCRQCNGRLLTAARDNPAILERAAWYLRQWPSREVIK